MLRADGFDSPRMDYQDEASLDAGWAEVMAATLTPLTCSTQQPAPRSREHRLVANGDGAGDSSKPGSTPWSPMVAGMER